MLKRKNIVILAVAILCGLIGVFLITNYVNSVKTVYSSKPMGEVVIALKTIPENVRVTRDMVKVTNMETGYILSQACTRIEDVVGTMTKSSIFKDEQVLQGRITRGDKPGEFAYGIPDGKRAVAVSLDAVKGVAGFIKPHDRVDVLATINIPDDNSGSAEGQATATDGNRTVNVSVKVSWEEELKLFQKVAQKLLEGRRIVSFDGKTLTFTLFQNIEVLAVGNEIKRPENDDSKVKADTDYITKSADTIVLCLDPLQVELLTNTEKVGSIKFDLRNPGEDKIVEMEPIVEYNPSDK